MLKSAPRLHRVLRDIEPSIDAGTLNRSRKDVANDDLYPSNHASEYRPELLQLSNIEKEEILNNTISNRLFRDEGVDPSETFNTIAPPVTPRNTDPTIVMILMDGNNSTTIRDSNSNYAKNILNNFNSTEVYDPIKNELFKIFKIKEVPILNHNVAENQATEFDDTDNNPTKRASTDNLGDYIANNSQIDVKSDQNNDLQINIKFHLPMHDDRKFLVANSSKASDMIDPNFNYTNELKALGSMVSDLDLAAAETQRDHDEYLHRYGQQPIHYDTTQSTLLNENIYQLPTIESEVKQMYQEPDFGPLYQKNPYQLEQNRQETFQRPDNQLYKPPRLEHNQNAQRSGYPNSNSYQPKSNLQVQRPYNQLYEPPKLDQAQSPSFKSGYPNSDIYQSKNFPDTFQRQNAPVVKPVYPNSEFYQSQNFQVQRPYESPKLEQYPTTFEAESKRRLQHSDENKNPFFQLSPDDLADQDSQWKSFAQMRDDDSERNKKQFFLPQTLNEARKSYALPSQKFVPNEAKWTPYSKSTLPIWSNLQPQNPETQPPKPNPNIPRLFNPPKDLQRSHWNPTLDENTKRTSYETRCKKLRDDPEVKKFMDDRRNFQQDKPVMDSIINNTPLDDPAFWKFDITKYQNFPTTDTNPILLNITTKYSVFSLPKLFAKDPDAAPQHTLSFLRNFPNKEEQKQQKLPLPQTFANYLPPLTAQKSNQRPYTPQEFKHPSQHSKSNQPSNRRQPTEIVKTNPVEPFSDYQASGKLNNPKSLPSQNIESPYRSMEPALPYRRNFLQKLPINRAFYSPRFDKSEIRRSTPNATELLNIYYPDYEADPGSYVVPYGLVYEDLERLNRQKRNVKYTSFTSPDENEEPEEIQDVREISELNPSPHYYQALKTMFKDPKTFNINLRDPVHMNPYHDYDASL